MPKAVNTNALDLAAATSLYENISNDLPSGSRYHFAQLHFTLSSPGRKYGMKQAHPLHQPIHVNKMAAMPVHAETGYVFFSMQTARDSLTFEREMGTLSALQTCPP